MNRADGQSGWIAAQYRDPTRSPIPRIVDTDIGWLWALGMLLLFVLLLLVLFRPQPARRPLHVQVVIALQ
jgi:hypothetical protein